MLFSIIIPARNEESHIKDTLCRITSIFTKEGVNFEVLVVDDGSTDRTKEVVEEIGRDTGLVKYIFNGSRHGFGLAVRKGLSAYKGGAVAVVMADGSDNPEDILTYYRKVEQGYDCVFGSRFLKGSKCKGYPFFKLIINRLANWGIKFLFRLDNNDITNAFKCYRKQVIDKINPLVSEGFNITVEMPLKAIVCGYKYLTIPVDWSCRKKGFTKFKIEEAVISYLPVIWKVLAHKRPYKS
jgi:dolichol-phosphate mannosyltransferase